MLFRSELKKIVADELGADWRTVAVQPAPPGYDPAVEWSPSAPADVDDIDGDIAGLHASLQADPAALAGADLLKDGSVFKIAAAFTFWGMASHAFGAVQDIKADREGGLASIATAFGARDTVRFAFVAYLAAGLILTVAVWPIPVAALAAGGLLAARGQGIVETMVSVNVIYIASVGVVFAALLRGIVVPVAHAGAIMATGFSVAFATYVAGWTGWLGESADIVSLVSGLGASATMALCCALYANRVPGGGSSVRG